MATPIAATPKLDATATKKFLKRVEKNLKTTTAPIPTPNMQPVINQIMQDAYKGKKQLS